MHASISLVIIIMIRALVIIVTMSVLFRCILNQFGNRAPLFAFKVFRLDFEAEHTVECMLKLVGN